MSELFIDHNEENFIFYKKRINKFNFFLSTTVEDHTDKFYTSVHDRLATQTLPKKADIPFSRVKLRSLGREKRDRLRIDAAGKLLYDL